MEEEVVLAKSPFAIAPVVCRSTRVLLLDTGPRTVVERGDHCQLEGYRQSARGERRVTREPPLPGTVLTWRTGPSVRKNLLLLGRSASEQSQQNGWPGRKL